jgi:hypothetical protein
MADGIRPEPAVHRTAGFLVLASVIGMGPLDLTFIPEEVRSAVAGPRPARGQGIQYRLAPVADGSLPPHGRIIPSRGIVGTMATDSPKQDQVTVILPPEPPALTREATRILLRILVEASEKQAADKTHRGVGAEQQPGDH